MGSSVVCLARSESRDLDVAEDAASTLSARRLRVWRLVASLMQPVDLDAPRSEGAGAKQSDSRGAGCPLVNTIRCRAHCFLSVSLEMY